MIYPALCVDMLESQEEEGPVECRNGTIVLENVVPGAYQHECMVLPQRSIPLKSTGDIITILQQGTNVGAGTTGVTVWNSCLLLTRLLDSMCLSSSTQETTLPLSSPSAYYCCWLQSKTVIELGCGTGLASIAASKLGARRVLATDGNVHVVRLAQDNVRRNHVEDIVKVTQLQWGFVNAVDMTDVADVVIGSDLTYNSGTWRVLAETLSTVLRPGGIFLYLSLGHVGFNVQGELDGFLSVVQSEGLKLFPTEGSSSAPPPFRNLSRRLLDTLSPQEQSVLESTGGVRVIVLQKPAGNGNNKPFA